MEHRCYKCGAAVEDGTAFCAQCSAPQIRVVTADSILPSEAVPSIAAPRISYSAPRNRSRMEWAHALPAAFLGLLIATALSTFDRGAFWFGILVAGFLSVYFYRRRSPFAHLTLKLGARLGAISGVLGFAIAAIAAGTAIALASSGKELQDLTLKALREQLARSPDPRMQPFLDLYATHQGFILMTILGSITVLLLFLALSSMGGMIGAAVLKRKDPI